MSLILRTLHYLGRAVFSPRRAFADLARDSHHLGVGLTAVLLLGTLYTFTVAGLAASGAALTVDPWLRIPPDRYYFWETFFTIPVFVCSAVLVAGTAYRAARSMGGRGTFEQTFAVLGVASTVPWYLTWIVETIAAALMLSGAVSFSAPIDAVRQSGLLVAFVTAYQAAALGWYLFLTPLAVRVVHGLGRGKTILAGATTSIALPSQCSSSFDSPVGGRHPPTGLFVALAIQGPGPTA